MDYKWLKNAKEIVELIEDSDFSARRNISDYIILLLNDLGISLEKVKLIESFFDKEYEERGDQNCRSQSEWGRISKMTKPCASENCNMLIPDDEDFCQFHCENLPF